MITLVTMQTILMTSCVVAANVLGASMTMPQVRQIYATRLVSGVSAMWVGAGVAGNAWWLAYGIGTSDPGILPVSLLSVIAYSAIAIGLGRFGDTAPTVRGLSVGLLTAAVPLPFALLWGWAGAGLVLGLLYGVQLAPAVIEVYRRVDLSGVSAATWAMASVEAALWGIYAWPQRNVGVLALGFVGVTLSMLVLLRLVRWRRAFEPAAIAVAV